MTSTLKTGQILNFSLKLIPSTNNLKNKAITVSIAGYLCVVAASNTSKIIVAEYWNEKNETVVF